MSTQVQTEDAGQPATKTREGRDASVETLRGLAAILLVAFHCIDGRPFSEAKGTFGYEHFGFSFYYLRMPLFTVISGWVYALRPMNPERMFGFIKGKGRRILVPMSTAVTITWFLRTLTSGKEERIPFGEVYRIYLFSYDVFWFLQSIFLVFVATAVLERYGALSSRRRWLISLAAASVACYYIPGHDCFSFWGFLYLLPFFTLGIGLNRYSEELSSNHVVIPAVCVSLLGLTLQQLVWFGHLDTRIDCQSWLSLITGLSTTIVFFRVRIPVAWLARLGLYSYCIYLYHACGISLAVRLSRAGGLENDHLVFAAKLLLGVSLPIIAELVLMRFSLGRRVFLGLRK